MANTNIGFTINIDGIDNIGQLNAEVKQTKKELEGLTKGTEEYAQTAEKLAKLQAEQKALRKEQQNLTKSFLEQTNALGAYDKASAKLNRLRKEFKNLAIEGKASTKEGKALREEIEKLDKELKSTDATVGQFQRNVGNYPRIFGQSTKAILKQIPALDKLNTKLEKATGVSNVLGKALVGGFIAFRAAKVIGQVFKQFDELVKKIDEVRGSVADLSGAAGEDLDNLTASVSALATTFDVDAEQLNKSAAALAEELGISFESALGKIEEGLLSGVESNEEFLASIEQSPQAFKEVTASIDGYSDRQKDLLEANKELASAQIELTNTFSSSASGVKTFATNAQTFLIKTLLAIVDAFKPVFKSVVNFGKAIGSLVGSLFGAGDAAKGFQNILAFLAEVLDQSVKSATFFINVLRAGVDLLTGDASTAFKLFTAEGKALAQAEEQLASTTKELTNEFQNETKELNNLFGQLANTNKNTEERSKLISQLNEQYGDYLPNIDLEAAGQEELAAAYEATTKAIAQNLIDRKKLQLQSEAQNEFLEDNIRLEQARQDLVDKATTVKQIDEEIARLREQGASYITIANEIRKGTKAFRQFEKAQRDFNKVQKETNQNTAANKKEIELLDAASGRLVNTLSEFVDLPDAQAKAAQDAASRAAAAAKKAEEEKAKAQEEANKSAIARQKKFLEQLKRDREKFLNDEIKFLEQQAAIVSKLSERTEKLILSGIQDAQQKARAQSKEASKQRVEAAQAEFNQLIEIGKKREEEALRLFGEGSDQLKAAQEQSAKNEIEAQKQLNSILTRERLALTNELLAIDEQFRKQQEAAQEAASANALAIQRQQLDRRFNDGLIAEQEYQNAVFELEKKRIAREIELVSKRIEAGEDENNALLLQKESLLTQLSQLEKNFTDSQKQEAQKQADNFKKSYEDRFQQIQQDIQNVLGFAQQGLELVGQFQDAQFQRQQAQLSKLEEDNQRSNELLQERLDAASGLEAEFIQQKIDRNVQAAQSIAKQQEAIERQQAKKEKARAIIQSIIQTALAVTQALPNPVAATIAGIAGAAQTAVIAAQPLATGGVVGNGNIKPLSNGDNVIATLTTGEVVLNQDQQRRIGGAPVFRAAGVPGFAQGGLVGAPSSLTVSASKDTQKFTEMLSALKEGIEATNSRIDRVEVVYTAQTQDDVEKGNKDKEDIQVNASF
jgi:myosin heavy subunit